MRRHRTNESDDELEPILEEEERPWPALSAAPRRPFPLRRLAAVLVVLLGGVGIGWQLGVRSGGDTAELSSAPPPSTWPPLTTTMPPAPPEAWAGEGDHRPMELSLRRTALRVTSEGITVRSLLPADSGCGDVDWCPPPECRSGSGLVVQVSTDDMVGAGWSTKYPEVQAPPLHVGGWSVVGVAEGDPVVWVAVKAPPEAVDVSLEEGEVVRDRAGVTEGWAALAARGATGHDHGLTVVAHDKGGREVGRSGLEFFEPEVPLPPRCEYPGPALPSPGVPPSDPDAARQAIQETYHLAFTAGVSRNQKLAAITETTGVETAMNRLASRYPDSIRASKVEIGEIVFTSPVQAQLHFEITFGAGSSLGKKLGGAAFVDGRWKVLRSTVCEVLAAAGESCSWS